MKKQLFRILILSLPFFPAMGQGEGASVEAPRTDSLYRSLLDQERALTGREDSLQSLIGARRAALRGDAANAERYSNEILQAEEQLFDLRTRLGVLASRINAMEQERILNHLFEEPEEGRRTSSSADLLDHPWIAENLEAEEYDWLRDRGGEATGAVFDRFRAGVDSLRALAVAYAGAADPASADSLYGQFRRTSTEIARLEADFQRNWSYRFDQEMYLYAYLLDRLNRMDDLAALNEKARGGAGASASADEVLSPVFADYPFQRRLSVDYQLALARALDFPAAVDSLQRVYRTIDGAGLDAAPITLAEREYVAYEPIAFPEKNPYTAENPIPELTVPETGTVYSVGVGTFTQRQPVSVFRGAAPVYFERGADGRWRYFVGLLRTYDEAEKGVKRLLEKGFRRPEPVRWREGVYENLTEEAAANEGFFRLRIAAPAGELPDDFRERLARYAPTKEITRAGETIAVGTFTNRLHAEETADALRRLGEWPIEVERVEE